MSPSVTEVLSGLGSFSLEHEWDPDIAEILKQRYCHIVLHWGETPFYAGVVTSVTPGKDGMTIAGRGLDWWLGMDNDGPVTRDREYIAGTNRLSNGNFAFGDDLWRLADGTLWTVNGTAVFAGGSLLVDDELEYDEAFSTRPGHVWRAAVSASGGGGLGKLRLRTVYRGKFRHPNLLTNPGFELTDAGRGWSADTAALSIVADAPNAHGGSRVLRAAPVAKPQLVGQPSFETGGTGWSAASYIAFVNDATKARTGSWAMRLGPIDRPQLLHNPSFEAAGNWTSSTYLSIVTDATNARTGSKVLRADEIAKPQLLPNPGFEGTSGWAGPSAHQTIITDASNAYEGTGVLRVSPITQPQLLTNPGFESGTTGWNIPGTGEFGVPLSTPENVFQGSGSMKAGPVNRANIIANPDFDSGSGESFANWVHSPPPTVGTQPGDWYHDTGTKYTGAASAATTGGDDPYVNPSLAHKFMRSHPSSGESHGYAVNPGEQYRYEVKVRAIQDDLGRFDGSAHISVVFRPTLGGPTSTWKKSNVITAGAGEPGWEWNDLALEFEVPDDMTIVEPHFVVDDHHRGRWHVDQARMLKLRDNVSEAYSNSVTVEPEQTYEVSAMVKSGVNMSLGEIQLRVELTGPSVPAKNHTTTPQGSTKRRGFSARDWVRIAASFKVEEGYTTARVFVMARDVLGDSFRVDNVELRKTSNNIDEFLSAPIGVTPKQRYELAAYVRSGTNLKGGTVHIRVRLLGTGKPDLEFVTTRRGATKNKWERIATTFTPPKGYTFAAVAVVATDVLGDFFWVDRVEVIKDSNNTDSVTATGVSVVAEQSYRISAHVRPSEGTTEGGVFLRARLVGSDGRDTYQESPRVGLNEDMEWVETSMTVRPGRRQSMLVVSVVSIDVEGDPLWVDDVLVEKADNNSATTSLTPAFSVVAGSRYRLVGHVRSDEFVSRGSVTLAAVLTGAGVEDSVVQARVQRNDELTWDEVSVEINVPVGYTQATLQVTGTDIDGDQGNHFWLDDITLTRMTGNSETMTGVAFSVIPERRYRWTMWVRSDSAELLEGNVRLGLKFTAVGRPDVVVQSSPSDGEGSDWKQVAFDFTPPSGYPNATPSITATDVGGGYFWVDDGDIRDTDSTTQVHDLVVPSTASTFLDTTAPDGAEKVQVSLIAEANASAYTVTSVSLSRVGTPPTVASIVDDLLRDPVTQSYTSLLPGTIHGTDSLLYDWHLRNTTARKALIDLCTSGVALPVREYRVNPDFTLDFGTAEQLFEPRPEIVLVEDEAPLLDKPTVEQNSEDLITNVVVMGADRDTPSGIRRIVEGEASSSTDVLDRFGNPARRTRIMQESTLPTNPVADAYADYQLEQANAPRDSIQVRIDDWRALGGPDPWTAPDAAPSFRPGDWVYVYKPEAGIEDPANGQQVRGRVVFPAPKRVLSRTLRMGAGFWALLIPPSISAVQTRSYGSYAEGYGSYGEGYGGFAAPVEPIKLLGVRWENQTEATLELGGHRAEFATDPQGGSFASQFLRFRASAR